MARTELTPLPPAEAVRFFRNKGFVIGFDWRDVWQDERARVGAMLEDGRPGQLGQEPRENEARH